jgi:isopenicillin-N epimerase
MALDRRFPELVDGARCALAAYVRADAANLSFAPNASTALNTVIRSLRLEPGDEVLMGDAEYGGMEILWEFIAARSGARLVRVPFAELEPGPRTRVVFCSHIEWISGRVNDLGTVIDAARDAGALSIVDGAHAPGQIPLALDELAPDVYAGNCHKWLCAPKGSAFLYARPEVQPQIDPLVVSWDFGDDNAFDQLHRWQGTRDPAAYLAVQDAIAFQAEHDWPAVRERCHALLADARIPLEPLTDEFVQMRGFALPDGVDGAELKRQLYDEHRVEVPIVQTRDGGWTMRVSVQAYNDEGDLDALAQALRA